MLRPGDYAPEIDAVTTHGMRFRLSARSSKLCTVVFFFPAAFTPGCTVEAKRFRDMHVELTLAGAEVIGVSTDTVSTQSLFARSLKAPFALVADEDKRIARSYGVLWPVVERAMRATFVINRFRTIEAAVHHEIHVGRHRDDVDLLEKDPTRRPASAREVLARLDAI
jgi:peroxiredoxin Q/BCP